MTSSANGRFTLAVVGTRIHFMLSFRLVGDMRQRYVAVGISNIYKDVSHMSMTLSGLTRTDPTPHVSKDGASKVSVQDLV